MTAILINQVPVTAKIKDLESFRRWAKSPDLPRHGWFSYLASEVWVDVSLEELFTHNRIKTAFSSVLAKLVRSEQRGYFFSDRTLLSNVDADLSTEPDGAFVSFASIEQGTLKLVEDKKGAGYVELEGTPDMVLEIVSESSVRKDAEVLRELYWTAGIPEYWLVDVRREPIRFDILRHTARAYVPTRRKDGWVKSTIFGKSFSLQTSKDRLGHPEYDLQVM